MEEQFGKQGKEKPRSIMNPGKETVAKTEHNLIVSIPMIVGIRPVVVEPRPVVIAIDVEDVKIAITV